MTDESSLEALYGDPVLAARVLFPHWFPKKMPWFHRGLLAILLRRTDFLTNFGPESWEAEEAEWTPQDLELILRWFRWEKPDGTFEPLFSLRPEAGAVDLRIGRFSCFMLPRGFAKTTITNFATVFKILYKLRKFVLLVSETGTHARKQLDNIKAELEANERIRLLFGNLVPGHNDEQVWTQDEARTTHGVYIVPRGRGGQVRGLNDRGNRPDDITVDDLEDEEAVSTAEQRDKCLTWFLRSLLPVLPRLNSEATLTVLGTLLHREALLMNLSKDTRFTFVRFGAKLPDGTWLWPENMDEKGWEAERQIYAAKNKLGAFYMEYGSEIRSEDSSIFKPRHLEGIVEPLSIEETVGRAIVIDPAISSKVGADATAFAVVGMTPRGRLQVYHSYSRVGMTPREQVDMYFELAARWQTTHHGVEGVAYQAALIHLLREEMFRKRQYFEITDIRHATKKSERIAGVLQPRYAAGYVRHQQEFPKVNAMLLDFPNGGFDDIDAIAMAVTLLDPFAAQAADPDHDIEADEYEELEAMVGGSVRHAP